MELTKIRERNYGIDILKIISMFMIVMLHVTNQGGVLSNPDKTVHYWTAWVFEISCYCAVNSFALTSGYLIVGRKFKYRKIFSLWVVVISYYIFCTLLSIIVSKSVSSNDITGIFIINNNFSWYFSSYFCMYMFIPFMNFLIEKLNKKDFYIFLITGFIIFSIMYILPTLYADPFCLKGGYSPLWLMYLYFIGAGIYKYDMFTNMSAKKAILGYLAFVAFTYLIKLTFTIFAGLGIPKISAAFVMYGENRLISYISPTILGAAVCLLLFCSKIKVRSTFHKPLKTISPMVFQISIFHSHYFFWNFLIDGRYVHFLDLPVPLMVLGIFLATSFIFVLGLLIDSVRILIFKLIKVDKHINTIADKITIMFNSKFGDKLNRL